MQCPVMQGVVFVQQEIAEKFLQVFGGFVDALFQVQTFYEQQYLAQGIPITYLAFTVDHEGPYVSPEWEPDRWER